VGPQSRYRPLIEETVGEQYTSRGEAHRLKLAEHTFEKCTASTLFLFYEPSTGLHHFDFFLIIDLFESLVTRGDTILFLERIQTLLDAAE